MQLMEIGVAVANGSGANTDGALGCEKICEGNLVIGHFYLPLARLKNIKELCTFWPLAKL